VTKRQPLLDPRPLSTPFPIALRSALDTATGAFYRSSAFVFVRQGAVCGRLGRLPSVHETGAYTSSRYTPERRVHVHGLAIFVLFPGVCGSHMQRLGRHSRCVA